MTDIKDSSGNPPGAGASTAGPKHASGATMVSKSQTPKSQDKAAEPVPEWLGSRLRQMFTDVMHEPIPDEFADLLKQLEDKERG